MTIHVNKNTCLLDEEIPDVYNCKGLKVGIYIKETVKVPIMCIEILVSCYCIVYIG